MVKRRRQFWLLGGIGRKDGGHLWCPVERGGAFSMPARTSWTSWIAAEKKLARRGWSAVREERESSAVKVSATLRLSTCAPQDLCRVFEREATRTRGFAVGPFSCDAQSELLRWQIRGKRGWRVVDASSYSKISSHRFWACVQRRCMKRRESSRNVK